MSKKLHFRYGAMGAGKSAELLQVAHNYQRLGRPARLLTAAVDDRAGSGVIASRLGISSPAEVFTAETDLYNLVKSYRASVAYANLGSVLVDEAQFLTATQVRQLHSAVHTFGVPVICFGLRSDFRGEPFEGSATLLALADVLAELKTLCACGAHATMNMRLDAQGRRVNTGPQVLIGDATYRAVCARCFYN